MKIEAKKEVLASAKTLIQGMIDAGKLVETREPVWVAGATLATAERIEGTVQFEGSQIVFKTLPKELSDLNGKGLRLKGKGALVRICIATAVVDWKPDEKLIAEAKTAGRRVPSPIKKGEQQIRCFS